MRCFCFPLLTSLFLQFAWLPLNALWSRLPPMASYILFIWAGVVNSVPAALYLIDYIRLVKAGKQTSGEITSFDRSEFTFFREILVPIVRFTTEDGSLIEGPPNYSFFHRLNGFMRHSQVRVYYQASHPQHFVIASQIEVVVNWLVLAATLCLIIGLFFV